MSATLAILTSAEWSALRLSLMVATLCVSVSLLPGIFLGWLLARRRFPGRALLDALIHLPLVLPPVVVGYMLLLLLGRQGLVGGWLHETFGIRLAFTTSAAAIASALMAFPLLVRPIRLAIELTDPRLEQAARTLGASPRRVFFTVTLPLAMPGVITGMVLAFARSLGEFGATITFAGNTAGETRTLPLAIFTATQIPGGDAAALRLSIIAIVVALLAMLISEVFARRLQGRAGRASSGARS